MAKTDKPERTSRLRAVALPWIGGRRRAARADGRPVSPGPTWRRLLRIGLGALLGLGALGAVAWLAILYLPLPAAQVVPRVTAALEERLGPDFSVSIADAELQRSREGVELRLVDLAIGKKGEAPLLANIPRAELKLDGMSLLAGDVKVRSVHVTSPKLDLPFDAAVGQSSKQLDLPARILDAIGDIDRLLGPDGAAGALEEVQVSGATIIVAPRARQRLALDGVNLRLARGAGGAIALSASSSRPDDRWSGALTVSAKDGDQSRALDLGVENLDIAPYSAPFAEKAGAPPVTGRISGHLNARIGADAGLAAGEGRMEAVGLEFPAPGAGPQDEGSARAIGVDRAQLAFRWDADKRAIVIAPSQIVARSGQITLAGAISAPADAASPWTAAIEGRDVLIAGETAGDAPLRLDRIDMAASFDPNSGVLDVSRVQLLGPTTRAGVTVNVRFEGESSPAVRLGVVTEPMPASALKRLWPAFLATSVRSWVLENVGAGSINNVALTIDVKPGVLAKMQPHEPLPDGAMQLDIGFTEGVLRGSAGMPWIENAAGRVVSTARRTDVMIDSAQVAGSEADGALAVSKVVFTVPDLAPRNPPARLTLKADGSLRRALTMLGSGAFGANPIPAGIDASKVTGRIASEVAVDLELAHDAGRSPPPVVNATADMREVRIADAFAGKSFEKGTLQLKVSPGPTRLTGRGQISGAPATVEMSDLPAAENGAKRRKLDVMLTADAADLQRLGLDVPGALKGQVPLAAELQLDDPKAPIKLSADLTKVGIDGLVPGFRKPAGRAGKLGFIVEKGADKTVIKDFSLESGDRSVRGTIEFGAKGDLLAATLPIYRPGPGDDAQVEIDKAKGGITRVSVQGAALDLKPLLDRVRGKPGGGGAAAGADKSDSAVPKNLDVTAKLGTGLGYGGEAVAGLDIKLQVRDGKVKDADGTGRIGSGPISLATGADGRLAIAGRDAGAFFRFADLYGRIDGGAFTLNASLAGGPGVLRINKFAVRNETALERVRRTTGADQGVADDAPRTSTQFDRLQVSFVQSGGQIRVNEAVVYGPQLGATLEGAVNYSADRVDLVGTFVPIYALNNLVSRVPIIGQLLGGGRNGGLVGVTFQVKGPTSSPTVSVNPMSAVAPGFLRKIFEFRQNDQSGEPATGSAPRAGQTQQ